MFLPDGYDVTQFRPDGSAAEVTAFHQIIGGVVAGCFTMPVGRALGTYAAASYPGVRAEMLPYHKAIAIDRYQVWEPLWLTPLYDAFIHELQATNEWHELLEQLVAQCNGDEACTPLDPSALDVHEIEWVWPERELVVDPSREENSRKLKLAMGLTDREREMDSVDLDERDRRAAAMLGIDDVQVYRRMVAQAIMGVPVPESTPPAGATPAGGEFGNLGRRQFQNNRKAIRDVLQDFIDGTASEAATLQMLQSLGLPVERAEALIDDAIDKVVDDPEFSDSGGNLPRVLEPGIAAAWLQIAANCGTGAGGFQTGNTCAKGSFKKGTVIAGEVSGRVVGREKGEVIIEKNNGRQARVKAGELRKMQREGLIASVEHRGEPPQLTKPNRPDMPVEHVPLTRARTRDGVIADYQTEITHPATNRRVAQVNARLQEHQPELDAVRERVLAIDRRSREIEQQIQTALDEHLDLSLQRDAATGQDRKRLAARVRYRATKVRELRQQHGALRMNERELAIETLTSSIDSTPVRLDFAADVPAAVQSRANDGAAFLSSVTGKAHGDVTTPVKLTTEPRAFVQGGVVHLNAASPVADVAHEMGHIIEQNPQVHELARGFLHHRVGGAPLHSLRDEFSTEYADHEMGHRGGFDRLLTPDRATYTGKFYNHHATEVISMGAETLYNDPVRFARDEPEFFRFTVGILSGQLL